MTVVHVLNHFLPHQTAGTEVYTFNLIRELAQQGIGCVVVIPNYGYGSNDSYVYQDITVHQFAQPDYPSREVILGLRPPAGVAHFAALLKQLNTSIVHFHELAGSTGIGIFHVEAAKALGLKTMMTFHLASNTCRTGTMMYLSKSACDGEIRLDACARCVLVHQRKGKLASWLVPVSKALYQRGISTLRWNNRLGTALGIVEQMAALRKRFDRLNQSIDQFVSLTHWYRDVLVRNGVPQSKIMYIPQALPLRMEEQKEEPALAKSAKEGPLKLLFLGRISPFKGLHLLIDALLPLPQHAVTLEIYGQTNDASYEQKLRERSSAHPNIQWKGTLSRENVLDTLRRVDALCLCSTFSEMSPLVIQEAFAAGTPVIASNVPGNAEQIIPGENGYLFEFNNTASLSRLIESCLEDPSKLIRLKKQGCQPSQFSALARKYSDLYRELNNIP